MGLSKQQIEKYADVLIWGLRAARSKPFKEYDVIFVRYDPEAIPLAETIQRKLLKQKFNVILRSLSSPLMEKNLYTFTDKNQRTFIGKWEDVFIKSLNGSMLLSAPISLTHLKNVNPLFMNEIAVARKYLRDIIEERENKGLFGWTLCESPTLELSKKAKLSLKEYTNQIVKACFLNEKDPVKKWKRIFRDAMKIKKWLNSLPVKTMNLQSKSSDLTILLGEKRKFLGISGHNIPSFEIFTSPDWHKTNGIYHANLPSYRSGNYVTNVTLEFKNGNVIKSEAGQGDNFLKNMLKQDAGAKRIGEFSLTDKRFSKINKFMANTLFDENFGGQYGNSHIAVGASFTDTYKGNPATLNKLKKKKLGFNDSSLHWDMVNTEDKIVTAVLKNGKKMIIYEKGMFKY